MSRNQRNNWLLLLPREIAYLPAQAASAVLCLYWEGKRKCWTSSPSSRPSGTPAASPSSAVQREVLSWRSPAKKTKKQESQRKGFTLLGKGRARKCRHRRKRQGNHFAPELRSQRGASEGRREERMSAVNRGKEGEVRGKEGERRSPEERWGQERTRGVQIPFRIRSGGSQQSNPITDGGVLCSIRWQSFGMDLSGQNNWVDGADKAVNGNKQQEQQSVNQVWSNTRHIADPGHVWWQANITATAAGWYTPGGPDKYRQRKPI